jgi:hypothetical protein
MGENLGNGRCRHIPYGDRSRVLLENGGARATAAPAAAAPLEAVSDEDHQDAKESEKAGVDAGTGEPAAGLASERDSEHRYATAGAPAANADAEYLPPC